MKKFTCTLLCLLLVSIVGICVYNIAPDVQDSVQSKAENKRIEAIVNENTEEDQSFSRTAFDELYAVNSLNINGTVLVPKGFPQTLKIIEDLGYPTILMDTNEFRLIDGSLTCLSLRF